MGRTPAEVFWADAKPLSFPDSDAELRSRFVVHIERTATKDHIVSIDGTSTASRRKNATGSSTTSVWPVPSGVGLRTRPSGCHVCGDGIDRIR